MKALMPKLCEISIILCTQGVRVPRCRFSECVMWELMERWYARAGIQACGVRVRVLVTARARRGPGSN